MGGGASSKKKRRVTSSQSSSAVEATAPATPATTDRKPANTGANNTAGNSTSNTTKRKTEKLINKSHSSVYANNNEPDASFSPSKPAYTPFREKAPKLAQENRERPGAKSALSATSRHESVTRKSEQKVEKNTKASITASSGQFGGSKTSSEISRAAGAGKPPKSKIPVVEEDGDSEEESDGQSYSDTSHEDDAGERTSKQKVREIATTNKTDSSGQLGKSKTTSEISRAVVAQKPPQTPILPVQTKNNDSEQESDSIGHVSWASGSDEDTDGSEHAHGRKSKNHEDDEAASRESSEPKKSATMPTPVAAATSESDGARSQQKKQNTQAAQRETRSTNDDSVHAPHSQKLRGLLRKRHQNRAKATPKKFKPLLSQLPMKGPPTTQQRQLQMVLAQEQREDDRRRQRQMDTLMSQQQQFAWQVSSSRKLVHDHINTIKSRAQIGSPKEEDQFRRLLQQWRDLRIDKFAIKIQIQASCGDG